MRRFVTGLLILVSAVTLVLASTSLWTRRTVINTQVFVSTVDEVVDLPEVEARINDRVPTTVMATADVQAAIDEAVAVLHDRLQPFRPTVEDGIRSLIAAGVQRLLTNDPFRPLTDAALTSAHDQLGAGQPVRFTLVQAKNLVPDSAKDGIAGQVLDLLPNDVGVTILTPSDAPQVYTAIDLLESVWWWLGLLALATLAGALGVSRHRRSTLRAWSVTTVVLVLLVLVTLRIARGRVIVLAEPENRDAVGAIYDVIAGSLRSWTLWLLGAVLLVLVLTLVWGRLGLVAGVRRGVATARRQVQVRREARAVRADSVEPGGEVAGPVARESWTGRVAAWTRAFTDGLDLPDRAARLGAVVRDHRDPARWAGIAVGAVVLLFWPAPTLSVLIWIVALVALYLGALEWLQKRAPEPAPPAAGASVVTSPAMPPPDAVASLGTGNGPPVSPAVVAPPSGQLPSQAGANGVPTASSGGAVEPGRTAVASRSTAVPEPRGPEPLVPAGLTPETISTLNDRLALLVRLGAARDAGVLTEDEFSREKGRLLGV